MVFAIGALCLYGGVQRWTGITRTPEYDELYTLHIFASKSFSRIFSDVGTPNNHTLNTWCIKSLLPFFEGNEILALRLTSFLAGMGVLLLSLFAFFKIPPFRKSFAGGFFIALTAFNGALIHYAQTGRGYSLQSFWVLCAAFSFLYLLKKQISTTEGILFVFFSLFASLSACLSVSTGILYITGIFLAGLLLLFFQYKEGKEDLKNFLLRKRYFFSAGILFGLLALSYYLPLAKEFMKGAGFGSRLDLSQETMRHIWNIIKENDLLIPLIFTFLALIFAKKGKKLILFFLLAGFFPLLTGFLFRSGPPRVYVPAIPLILASGALGAGLLMKQWRKKTLLFALFPILLAASLFSISPQIHERLRGDDLGVTFSFLGEKVPGNFYPVFMPTESFALEMLYGTNALQEIAGRIPSAEGILLAGRGVGASDLKSGNSSVYVIPEKIPPEASFQLGGKTIWNLFPLEKISKEVKNHSLLFIFGARCAKEEMTFLSGKEKILNFRQNRLVNSDGKVDFVFVIPGKEAPFTLQEIRQWERGSSGRLRFLVLQGE